MQQNIVFTFNNLRTYFSINVRCRGGICGHLNPVNDKLYDVLERVFREMGQLFPSDTFHLGADEVEFLCWRKTPEVRQWMEARGMDPDSDADMFELWSQFQRNATARLRAAAPGVRNVTLWTSSLTSRDDLESKVPVKGHLIQIWTDSKDETIPKLMEKNYTVSDSCGRQSCSNDLVVVLVSYKNKNLWYVLTTLAMLSCLR